MNTLRWGMIGTGNVTEAKSGPAFSKVEGSVLRAVANRSPEKGRAYARRHGIPVVHENPLDLIHDPDIDLVYVATPPDAHLFYALEAIRAGKPVYLEKPMARTHAECLTINRTAAEAGVPVYVAYYRRALPYFLQVKSLLEEGRLGRYLSLSITQHFATRREDLDRDNPPWRVRPDISGGGYFHDVGCHALDILFYLFGDPVSARGLAANVSGLYKPEDSLAASVLLPGNLLLSGSWAFTVPPEFHADRVEVTGSGGRLRFSIFSFEPIVLETASGRESWEHARPEHIQMPLIETIVREQQGRGSCPSTGQTGAVASKAMEDILKG
ncbi:MAG: Gfo/Idh/MocA family oxidoreductase [Bacteroidales bacterium]